jgi:TPR repeat protein
MSYRASSKSFTKPAAASRKSLEEACELFEAGDRKRSVRLFLKAASEGVPEAQINLANIYDEGDGVKRDFARARYWYKRAVRRGAPEAAYNLGISYLNRGDLRWAKYWLTTAKSMGDDDAEKQLDRID